MRIRAEYYVGPELRFLANLDMKRMMERCLRRTSIPFALSEGFNPQIKLSMGTVLPVGIWGEKEYFDIELKEPMDPLHFQEALNEVLPNGARINTCKEIDMQAPALMKVINAASYAFLLEKGYPLEEIKGSLINSESLIVKSRGKKKDVDKDLKAGILDIEVKADIKFDIIKLLVAVGQPINVRYDELLQLLYQ
ncbi:MAG: DUF2344 domain-containing protein, partial [Syntrophomonadaceae bacterium]|nr:DUF2344 domain-containing protein [Syntrophomonadaceae bacterium]